MNFSLNHTVPSQLQHLVVKFLNIMSHVENQAQPSLVCEHTLRVYEHSKVKSHHHFCSINYVS